MASSIDTILRKRLSHTEYAHVREYIQNLELIAKQTTVLVTEGLEPLRRHENFILYPIHEENNNISDTETISDEEIVEEDKVADNGWKLHYTKN
jgi:hypothetical protein